MNGVDALRFFQVSKRARERVAFLGLLHQIQQGLNVARLDSMPLAGDVFGLGYRLPDRPAQPLRERLRVRIDGAGPCVELLGKQEVVLLRRRRLLAAGAMVSRNASLEIPQHLIRHLPQFVRHVEVQRGRFQAVGAE